MTDPFEYDVFISFSSADEEIVKPIWQELCSNGLRVFWSDSTLKKEVGNSWFEVIEKSLERSRHMLLVCSGNSISSKWVNREYRAFFDYCYSPGSRRLIPLLTHGFIATDLPIFLRELQTGRIDDPGFIQQIIPLLGGVNIEKLQNENRALKEQVASLSDENRRLIAEIAALHGRQMETSKIEPAASLLDENKRLIAEIKILKDRQQAASKKEFITEAFDPQEPGTGAGQLTGQETPGKANAEEVSGPGSTFLYVEGLPVDIDDPKLSSLFSEAGEVLSTKLLASGYFAKNGLVEMSSEEEAQNAITRFHRRKNSGVTLNVRIAGPKEKSLFDMSS